MSNILPDNIYVALLSLAEGFRTSSPPDIQSCLQCLFSILNIPIHPRIIAKTHLQIGNLILTHTNNIDIARNHVEKSWTLSQTIPGSDDIKLEAASVLASIYEKQNDLASAKQVLRKSLEESTHSVYWHLKLLLQLSQIHASERDFSSAASILSAGADFSQMSGSNYSRILFLLSKGMMLMIARRLTEVHPVLSLAGQLVEAWHGNANQKESLKVFFLVLQVCHHLNAGQVKSVKAPLKLLQQTIQNITTYHSDDDGLSSNSVDNFYWMAKEHMCVLVYLVTVLHSMQAGYMDRAQKYTEKALMQIEKLKLIDDHPLLHTFQLLLLEHIAMCRLVMGNGALAIKETVQALHICSREPRLKARHKPLIHALLGLYAMSMNCLDAAEAQFGSVLRTQTATPELRILSSLNLSIVYLRLNREQELNDLLAKLNPEALPSVYASQSLKAASYYVLGLNAFFQARYNDAKRYLRETLKMTNAEDLNRLTSCSLVLLGHIFYSLGNSRESMNMVTPAMQLASKIPDIHVQLWATALLKDLYRICGNPALEQEAIQTHHTFSQHLLNDHYQATQLQEHNYIHWLDEETNIGFNMTSNCLVPST